MASRNTQSSGRYFRFDRRGRKAFSLFNDWTVYEPVKSRYQMGEKKRQFVSIHNLETGKGWTLRGEHTVEEIEPDEIEDWKKLVKRDLNFVLKKRMNEEGMDLYYFGPEDIAGSGEHEAVEFLDSTNVSVVIYFSRENHLPAFLETSLTGQRRGASRGAGRVLQLAHHRGSSHSFAQRQLHR